MGKSLSLRSMQGWQIQWPSTGGGRADQAEMSFGYLPGLPRRSQPGKEGRRPRPSWCWERCGRREIETSVSGTRLDGDFLLRLNSCGIQGFRWYTANDGERDGENGDSPQFSFTPIL